MPERENVTTSPTQDQPPETAPDETGWPQVLLAFLASPAGLALNEKIADWVAAHNDGNRAEQRRETTALHWRFGLMMLVILATVGLRAFDRLDSTIIGFLGLALGFLFGRTKKEGE